MKETIPNRSKWYNFPTPIELIRDTHNLFLKKVKPDELNTRYIFWKNNQSFEAESIEELLLESLKADFFNITINKNNPFEKLDLMCMKSATQTYARLQREVDLQELFKPFEEIEERKKKENLKPVLISKNVCKPKIFISHGGDNQWEVVDRVLREKYSLDVISFDTGINATKSNINAVIEKIEKCNFGIIVHTGENHVIANVEKVKGNPDNTTENIIEFHARDNVIHETGLCHMRYGINRTLVLVENGSYVYSNYEGIQQIRFDKGNIKAEICEIIPVIDREFPSWRSN